MTMQFRARQTHRRKGVYLTGREHEIRPHASHDGERAPMSTLERTALAAGRLIFGGYFIYSGIRHFAEQDAMAGYAGAKGVAWPKAAVLGTGAMMLLGGLSVMTGVKPKLGASLVTTFLAGVTPMMHDYWNVEDQGRRATEMVNFTKNVALIGGAAFAAALASRRRREAA